MDTLNNTYTNTYTAKKPVKILICVVVLVLCLALGYSLGNMAGNKVGYKKAQADQKKLDEAAAKKATEDAIKAANPFQAVNPLEGVEVDPFEKTQKILNPFK